ncbi:MAG TPA: DUF2922 domain-containing protein [Thermotogaceae bacterium]|nr:DUF2922 domain-containing protein [Thermotogota bacterium]HEW91705.1 DUF2922 domain-containing protein [Thermotogaceae bacterium]
MKTLSMSFRNNEGRVRRLSLPEPKDTLTAAEVQDVMNYMAMNGVFDDFNVVDQAVVIDRQTNTLFDLIQ